MVQPASLMTPTNHPPRFQVLKKRIRREKKGNAAIQTLSKTTPLRDRGEDFEINLELEEQKKGIEKGKLEQSLFPP